MSACTGAFDFRHFTLHFYSPILQHYILAASYFLKSAITRISRNLLMAEFPYIFSSLNVIGVLTVLVSYNHPTCSFQLIRPQVYPLHPIMGILQHLLPPSTQLPRSITLGRLPPSLHTCQHPRPAPLQSP